MKFSRPAAVFAALVILTSGGSVAVGAAVTQTDPVMLCSNDRTGAVSVPEGGTCPRVTTEFGVASDADVAALAGRVDTAEGSLSAHSSDLAGLATSDIAQAGRIADLEAAKSSLEAENAAQSTRIAELEAAVAALLPGTLTVTFSPASEGFYSYSVRGTELKPGTDVVKVDEFSRIVLGQVATDGTFAGNVLAACARGSFHLEATRENGVPLVTESHTGVGC